MDVCVEPDLAFDPKAALDTAFVAYALCHVITSSQSPHCINLGSIIQVKTITSYMRWRYNYH